MNGASCGDHPLPTHSVSLSLDPEKHDFAAGSKKETLSRWLRPDKRRGLTDQQIKRCGDASEAFVADDRPRCRRSANQMRLHRTCSESTGVPSGWELAVEVQRAPAGFPRWRSPGNLPGSRHRQHSPGSFSISGPSLSFHQTQYFNLPSTSSRSIACDTCILHPHCRLSLIATLLVVPCGQLSSESAL